jgi:hypothetical protein
MSFEHSPILCGLSEETDCPRCIVKFWPLRRQAELESRLIAAGYDIQDFAELLLRPVTPKIERMIASYVDDALRAQQLSMLEAIDDAADRDRWRAAVMDLIFDDVVEIANAVYDKRSKRGKRIQAKAG